MCSCRCRRVDKEWNEHCVKSVKIRSFFCSVFSRIQTEYGEVRSISPYSVRLRENTDQKKLHTWTLFTQWKWNEIKSNQNEIKQKWTLFKLRKEVPVIINLFYQRWELFLQKYKNISYFHPWNSPLKINFWKSSSEFYQIIPLLCMNSMWECHKCIHNLFKLIR